MTKNRITLLLALLLLGWQLPAQWSDNPSENLKLTSQTGDQVIPKIALCPNGDYYVGYFSLESGNYNIRLQRLDNEGHLLWAENGLLISDHPSMSWLTDWEMEADLENHAILSWQDIRLSGNNNTVAYRISPDGEFVWGADGIQLSNSSAFDVAPKIAVTSANNAVFAWQADNAIILQKISPTGEKLWGASGIQLTHTNNLSWPQLMPVGNDEVIMKYYVDSGPVWAPTRHIYAQRYDAAGQGVWAQPVVISNAGAIQAWLQILPMINDGNDGFYIAWHDYRISGTAATAWLQHINSQGQAVFQANGVQLSNLDDANQFYPALAKPANDPNVYVYWNEVNGNQNLWGIFGQKVAADGGLLWGSSGKEIFPVTTQALLPQEAFSVENDVVLVYEHYFDGINTSLRAVRLNSEGSFVWEPAELMVSSVASSKVHLDIAPYDGKQWVLSWEDNRTGDVELYAQNINASGSIGIIAGSTGILSGTVSIEGGLADVTEVLITAGAASTYPLPGGSYSLELEAGTYVVTASHPHTQEVLFNEVVIQEGATTILNFELLMLRATLSCFVHDQYLTPLPEATVDVQGPENNYSGITNDDGIFLIENVPYGWYSGSAYFDDPSFPTLVQGMVEEPFHTFDFMLIIGATLENEVAASFSIAPNPAGERSLIQIRASKTDTYVLRMIDGKGNQIAEKQLRLEAGEVYHLPLTALGAQKPAAGVYRIVLSAKEFKAVQQLILLE